MTYKENYTNFQLILINLQNWQFLSKFVDVCVFVSITQEFSENPLNIKDNLSSFGFPIQELPSEEAIE